MKLIETPNREQD